jgi:glycosyltransferase involved in cell wall biosynthesis
MTVSQPLIEILLATYMGSEKLQPLLNSILVQCHKNWKIIVRDDGSDDATTVIIKAFADEHPEKASLVQDALGNLGPCGNFNVLLACSRAEYVMFCDQDDTWLPEKISLSLKQMNELENTAGQQPILVHTDLKVVDKDNVVISKSFWKHQNIHPRNRETINRLLVQNVVTGCTIMINKPLRDLALPIPDGVIMHDWWLSLVASAFGTIGHIEQPTCLYRQHGSNIVGAKRWSLAFVLTKTLGNNGQVHEGILSTQKQALVFLDVYRTELPEVTKRIIECYAFMDEHQHFTKVYLLLKHRMFKAGLIRNLGMWAHI